MGQPLLLHHRLVQSHPWFAAAVGVGTYPLATKKMTVRAVKWHQHLAAPRPPVFSMSVVQLKQLTLPARMIPVPARRVHPLLVPQVVKIGDEAQPRYQLWHSENPGKMEAQQTLILAPCRREASACDR